ncbi:MAG: hypothetical protein GY851_17150 [bacterium]|nr:hypothetical protein [bacterium]
MRIRILLAACLTLAVSAHAAPKNDPIEMTRTGIQRRVKADIADVRSTVEASKASRRARRRLNERIDGLEERFRTEQTAVDKNFRAILPLNPLHTEVFKVQAALWRAQRRAPLTVWQTNSPWDNLTLWDLPPRKSSPAIEVHMMRNEHRAAAFNISNATQETMTVRLRIESPFGKRDSDGIKIHQVEWTDTRTGRVVAAALPQAWYDPDDCRADDPTFQVDVPPGLTRQVWLTFDSAHADAGLHENTLTLSTVDERFEIPIALHVYPIDFPERPTLHSGGWDYTSGKGVYGVTNENRQAFLAHCVEHFVDSPWARSSVIPHGGHDDKGNMVSEPNTTNFDRWVERWPSARRLCTFPNFRTSFSGFELGTPEFQNAVNDYTRFWAAHAQKRGIEPEDFVWLLIDEPRDMATDTLIVAWAKAIRASGSGIQVWEDPIHSNMSKAHPELGTVCHILCPNRTMALQSPEKYGQYFLDHRDKGTTLEYYSCRGPARLLDPYAYYRMQAWSCWKDGAISTNFWAYGDNAGVSSWNEYIAPRTAYAPFFIDATSVTAGKHMEAIREGIEDFEYLVMLRDAVAAAEDAGRQDAPVKQGRALLNDIPDRVLNEETLGGFWWRDALDRDVADEARVEILDALVALKASP